MLSKVKHSFFLVCISLIAQAHTITVGLLNKELIKDAKITIKQGEYYVTIGSGEGLDTLFTIKKGQEIHLETSSKKIKVNYKNHLTFLKDIKFISADLNGSFEVVVNNNLKKKASYLGNLHVKNKPNELLLINKIDLEDYVAGVVEAEAGYDLPSEYYKLQAILVRTYVLKNLNKHQSEGFDVCNQVHCQAYHHKVTRLDINKAVKETKELIVVDEKLQLIHTVYHSNCGGETCNSEDVWVEALPYLKSVVDTFCLRTKTFTWTIEIPKEKAYKKLNWEKFITDSLSDEFIKICQDTSRIILKNVNSTPVTKLRSALNLKSTYFSVEEQNDTLYIYGKGYGHGVGLCQNGGIEMAKQGYGYEDILKFYYQDVFIVNLNSIGVFRE